jgi:hypothetical protein
MQQQLRSGYQVRKHLGFCIVNDRTIFLDIASNRYFALPPSLDDAFQRLISTEKSESFPPADIVRLEQAGILSASADAGSPVKPITAVTRALKPDGMKAGKLISARCVYAQAAALTRLRRRSLAWLPHWLERRRKYVTAAGTDEESWLPIVNAFAGTVLMRPHSDRCLSNSVAFLDVAFSRDLDARLVFGVYPSPFSAHCWVQVGDMALNDSIENIRAFKPILAL